MAELRGRFVSKIQRRYARHGLDRLIQGDVLRDVTVYQVESTPDGHEDVHALVLQYAVVVTQDCDLEQDFERRTAGDGVDKYLHSIILLPAFTEGDVKEGKHLELLGLKGPPVGKDQMARIRKLQETRYHFLHPEQDYQIPPLVLDFKMSFTVSRDELYRALKKSYLATMEELFREQLSQRFANYLSRIGTPDSFEPANVAPPVATPAVVV